MICNASRCIAYIIALLSLSVSHVVADVAGEAAVPRRGLVLWLDAADVDGDGDSSADPAEGERLSRWSDKSGAGNDVAAPRTDARPAFAAMTINGMPAVRFDGGAALERDRLAAMAGGDQAFHLFIVMRGHIQQPQTNPRLIDLRSTSAGDDPSASARQHGLWVGYQINGRNRLGIAFGDEGEARSVAWDGKANLVEVRYDGSQRWSQFFNGEPDGRGTFTQRTFLGFQDGVKLAIGQHSGYTGANTYYHGDLAEVLIYSRPLGDEEQYQVGLYLDRKYKLQTAYAAIDLASQAAPAQRQVRDEDRRHWAYQKLVRPAIPAVRDADVARTPIDAFVLAPLESRGLTLSPEADRQTLARRLYLDLLGLPPTPEQVDAFVDDTRPDAYVRLVDALLASPHFGQRRGRHWLDAAGYVDVTGGDNDAGTIKTADGKWRYRDYVIQCFNDDVPFDRFLVEQLAGDELVDWRSESDYSAQTRRLLIATGFLRAAADDTDENELNTADIRHRVWRLSGEIVAGNLLAMTIQCARCHDHKYDPIPQRDYYRWLATFNPAFNPRDWRQPKDRALPDVPPPRKALIDKHNADLDRQIKPLKEQRESAAKRDDAASAVAAIDQQIAALEAQRQRYGVIQAVYDVGPASMTRLLRRGELGQPGQAVAPALPAVLCDSDAAALLAVEPPNSHTSGRRLALARALTDPRSRAGALVARVQVNRLWQHLLGRPIVETTANFGPSGTKPTHPQLLEWLAQQFVSGGWRIKPLIRTIVLSSVYRQSSASHGPASAAAAVDPDNTLLWRMPLRRLESEVVRDSILAVSGTLNAAMGGPPLPLEVLATGHVVIKRDGLASDAELGRRSVYVLARRHYHLSMLHVFDQPMMSTQCTQRIASADVAQALAMLNDAFVLDQAEHLARRVESHGKSQPAASRAEYAFRLVLARKPAASELNGCVALVERHVERYRGTGAAADEASHQALVHLCHVLLNTSEFLYVP